MIAETFILHLYIQSLYEYKTFIFSEAKKHFI